MTPKEAAEMHRMQQEAIRRAQEMRSRAGQPEKEAKKETPETPEPPPPPPPQPPNMGSGLLDNLMKDSEKTLILVLILILVSEKADTELIFALMFLIL